MKVIASTSYFLVISLILAGCSLRYVPSELSLEPARIPPFKRVGTVTLTNAHESSEDISVSIPGATVTVNYKEYTDLVIKLLKSELDKRKEEITVSTPKVITVAIDDLKMFPMVGNFRCIINYTVKTGDGYVRGIEVLGGSWNYRTAIDMAVANVAVGVLNDEKILSYLEK